MKKSVLKWLNLAGLVAGLALFVYLIKQTGTDVIARDLYMMGWGFVAIMALSGLRNLLRAASWYYSIDPRHRGLSFWSLLNVMLAGEAIKYLTATGPFLAEPAKAAMVRRQVPLLEGLSSIVVENLIYNLTVVIFMLAGLPALALMADVPGNLKTAGYVIGIAIVIAVLIAWYAIRKRSFIFARLLEAASRGRTSRLERAAARVRSLEENVYSFYEHRSGAFYLIVALNMLAHLINVVEVMLILWLMGLAASPLVGFVVEAVTKVINLAFFFVPVRAGVYESGHAMVINSLGMSAGVGVSLAVIRKIRAMTWAGYGLAALAAMTVSDRRASRASAAGLRLSSESSESEI